MAEPESDQMREAPAETPDMERVPPVTVVDEGACLKIRLYLGYGVRLRFNRFGDDPLYAEAVELPDGGEILIDSMEFDGYPPVEDAPFPKDWKEALREATEEFRRAHDNGSDRPA